MSSWLTGFIAVVYIIVAVSEWYGGRHGFSLMFFSYALANVGVIWSMNQ